MKFVLSLVMLLGVFCCYLVINDIVSSPSLEEIQRQRQAMATWPAVTGNLTEISIKKDVPHSKGAYWYSAQCKYDYEVDGKSYSGTRLGIQNIESATVEELEKKLRRFFSESNVSSRKDNNDNSIFGTREIVLSFINQPVQVFYDPHAPASSILDPIDHAPLSEWDVMGFRLGFFILGAVLIVVPILNLMGRSAPSGQHKLPKQQPAACNDESHWHDWLKQGENLLNQQRYEEALTSLDRSIRENPCEPGTWQHKIEAQLLKCECLIALGNKAEAQRIFNGEKNSKSSNEVPWLVPRIAHVKKLLGE